MISPILGTPQIYIDSLGNGMYDLAYIFDALTYVLALFFAGQFALLFMRIFGRSDN